MAKTIRLKETDLTRIIRTISEESLLLEKIKWDWKLFKADIKELMSWWTIVSGIFSDSRLKKNIRRVGKSPSGIPIYEWEYKNKARFGKGTFRGVIAEQVPRKAVTIAANGYKKVDYSKLDVAFEKVNPNKRKSVRLSERDLSRVIRGVINERGVKPTNQYNPYEDLDDEFGGMSQGGGFDPMAPGNEEMETSGGVGGDASGGMESIDWDMMRQISTAGIGRLREVGQHRPELGAEANALADMMEEANRTNGQSLLDYPGGVPAAKKGWWKFWRRWVMCPCDTDPETHSQSCCDYA